MVLCIEDTFPLPMGEIGKKELKRLEKINRETRGDTDVHFARVMENKPDLPREGLPSLAQIIKAENRGKPLIDAGRVEQAHHHAKKAGHHRDSKIDMPRWVRVGNVIAGSALLIPGFVLFAIDQLTFHMLDGPLWLMEASYIALFYGALKCFNVTWRGYHVPEEGILRTVRTTIKNRKKGHAHSTEREPYDGKGYPASATTYAVENIHGKYDEGVLKVLVSRMILPLTYMAHIAKGMWQEANTAIHNIWKKKESDIPVVSTIEKAPVTLGVFVLKGVMGGGYWNGVERGHKKYREEYEAGLPKKVSA